MGFLPLAPPGKPQDTWTSADLGIHGAYTEAFLKENKNDFKISNKTWVYMLKTLMQQGFPRSDKCHGPMKDYVNNTSKSIWPTQPKLAIFSPQMNKNVISSSGFK